MWKARAGELAEPLPVQVDNTGLAGPRIGFHRRQFPLRSSDLAVSPRITTSQSVSQSPSRSTPLIHHLETSGPVDAISSCNHTFHLLLNTGILKGMTFELQWMALITAIQCHVYTDILSCCSMSFYILYGTAFLLKSVEQLCLLNTLMLLYYSSTIDLSTKICIALTKGVWQVLVQEPIPPL